jgi:PKD repeat protein
MSVTPLVIQGILIPSGTIATGQTITLTAAIQGGLFPYSSIWTFGDGTSAEGGPASLNQTHSYQYGGSYTVTVKVADALGTTASTSVIVTVTGPTVPGTMTLAPSLVDQGLSLSPSGTIIVGEALSVAEHLSGGVPPYTVAWSFGDGTIGSGSLTQSHVYSFPGGYTIRVTVTDSVGQSVTDQTAVQVEGALPPPPPPGFTTVQTTPAQNVALLLGATAVLAAAGLGAYFLFRRAGRSKHR